jgi:8-oxo-dGTP pyrophosphatase MutT (NUDIX family)
MEYLLELRKLVGHRPLLMVGAATLLVDDQGRLLLLFRSDNQCWGLPCGAVELGEIIESAARRELREETGLEVDGLSLFGAFSGPEFFYRYPNGDEVYNVSIIYLASYKGSEICLNGEHTSCRWFPVVDLPGNISPPLKPVIERFIRTNS